MNQWTNEPVNKYIKYQFNLSLSFSLCGAEQMTVNEQFTWRML